MGAVETLAEGDHGACEDVGALYGDGDGGVHVGVADDVVGTSVLQTRQNEKKNGTKRSERVSE